MSFFEDLAILIMIHIKYFRLHFMVLIEMQIVLIIIP